MSTALGASEKRNQIFVEFRYGDPASPSYARYTDGSSDTTFQSQTFVGTDAMELHDVEVSGFLNDKDVNLKLPLNAGSLQDQISKGERHSPVFVTIWEQVYPLDGSPVQTLVLFKGRVTAAIRNSGGRANVVRLILRGQKLRLDIPLGMPCIHQCPFTLGDRHCKVILAPENGTLASVDGKAATITGLSAHVDRYWNRGYVEKDGLRIMIRDWLSGTTFQLVDVPPASWTGQTVKVVPGCDKTIETCRTIWSNELNFGGVGYAIPAHHPIFELG